MTRGRDEFPAAVKRKIERLAGHVCSICGVPTSGANADGSGEITVGTAAHICAAAIGGPRYDAEMTSEQRKSPDNGIWLCRNHGDEVDDDEKHYTVDRLRRLKRASEQASWRRVSHRQPLVFHSATLEYGDLRERARADLATIRLTSRWPQSAVGLTVTIDGVETPLSSFGLATAAQELDDLILVAAPGMGKTTTLLQICQGVLDGDQGFPIYVALADWATGSSSLLGSILERSAWRDVTDVQLRGAAAQGRVVLLLDGWNELEANSRERARIEIERLKAEIPELALILSTRRQSIDLPFPGTRFDIAPLDDRQQLAIAEAIRGEDGATLLDRAWRTPHVRDLVAIPLYLNALMRLPSGSRFPDTREAVLRAFVEAHEAKPGAVAKLKAVIGPFARDYLNGLAFEASEAVTPSITDAAARRSIANTSAALIADGQIAARPDYDAAIAALVDNHILVRAGDTGIAFQHQQFLEWFASHSVEQRMLTAASSADNVESLQRDMLDQPIWEEAILFAVERMSRADESARSAAAKSILAAFMVDPMLAAQMIARATDGTWSKVVAQIVRWVGLWHQPGTSDRALRFMIESGRSEFVDLVWPLISNENDQVSLRALRSSHHFPMSLLGPQAAARVRALGPEERRVLLHEIAHYGDFDAMDFAVEIAANDPAPEVQKSVADALVFRRGDRHLNKLFESGSDALLEHVVQRGYPNFTPIASIVGRLEAARKRAETFRQDPAERLRAILLEPFDPASESMVEDLVAQCEPAKDPDSPLRGIYYQNAEYSAAVAKGLLRRLLAGRSLPYGAADLLAEAGFTIDDDLLVEQVISASRHDSGADAAASVLGPLAVGRLIDALIPVAARLRDRSLPYDKGNSDYYHMLVARITEAPVPSLIAAAQARSPDADPALIVLLAELLTRNRQEDGARSRPIRGSAVDQVRALAMSWAERLLAMDASRHDVVEIVQLLEKVPDVSLLPLLQRMLDRNLESFTAARDTAALSGWQESRARDEAGNPQTHQYLRAFLAIDAPETRLLMRNYLGHPHFGELAAQVICTQWVRANEPEPSPFFDRTADYRHIKARQEARRTAPHATDDDAEAIFEVIERLLSDGTSSDDHGHAVTLASFALRLPHGQRSGTIVRLLTLAHRRVAPRLITALIQSGEIIPTAVVSRGLDAVFEEAQSKPYMLFGSDAYELNDWLRLLPFTENLEAAIERLKAIAPEHRPIERIEPIVSALPLSASDGVEKALLAIAELYPAILRERSWYSAALSLGSESAALQLIAMIEEASVKGAKSSLGGWRWPQDIGQLITAFPSVRKDVYARLAGADPTPGARRLAEAVSNALDADGLLLLVELQGRWNMRLVNFTNLRGLVTEQIPTPGWANAFSIVPVSAAELRCKLLAATSDGSARDIAARTLTAIDEIRDEYGRAIDEPRHPDLASGRPWPILVPDPDATST